MSEEALDRLERAKQEVFKRFYEPRVNAVVEVLEKVLTDAFRKELDLTHVDFTSLVYEDAMSRIIAKLEEFD